MIRGSRMVHLAIAPLGLAPAHATDLLPNLLRVRNKTVWHESGG